MNLHTFKNGNISGCTAYPPSCASVWSPSDIVGREPFFNMRVRHFPLFYPALAFIKYLYYNILLKNSNTFLKFEKKMNSFFSCELLNEYDKYNRFIISCLRKISSGLQCLQNKYVVKVIRIISNAYLCKVFNGMMVSIHNLSIRYFSYRLIK